MALSCCASFNPYQHFGQETANFNQADFPSDILCFLDDYESSSSLLDGFWEANNQIHADPTSQLFPYITPHEPLLPISSENSPSDEFECFNFPKRIKTEHHGLCFSDYSINFTKEPILNRCPAPQILPEISYSAPALPQPMGLQFSEFDQGQKSNESGLSLQSVAARQRRKKISEKTQQLGKLIPGGNKMNTAGMLLAAYKYVKFMRAQIATLHLVCGLTKESKDKGPLSVEGLHPLLSSSNIQEKLYEEQKCLVPKGLVVRLAKDEKFQSSPSVAKQLHCLLE